MKQKPARTISMLISFSPKAFTLWDISSERAEISWIFNRHANLKYKHEIGISGPEDIQDTVGKKCKRIQEYIKRQLNKTRL